MNKEQRVGILAYGSLIWDPGWELEEALDYRIEKAETPFEVEYARRSKSRAGAPTLVPVQEGKGAKVKAQILVLKPDIDTQKARDMLYRRELNRVGDEEKTYDDKKQREREDAIVIETLNNFERISTVLFAKLKPNFKEILNDSITDLRKAEILAETAIGSVTKDTYPSRRDGIRYLSKAKENNIYTKLSDQYEVEIIESINDADDLESARVISYTNLISVQRIFMFEKRTQIVFHLKQLKHTLIPRAPWDYWVSDKIRRFFELSPELDQVAKPVVGLQTGKNFRFVRCWWETGLANIAFGCEDREEAKASGKTWFPYLKGGGYQKWYGNLDYVVNWKNDGKEIRNFYKPSGRLASRPQNMDYYFREGITWSFVSSSGFSSRLNPGGCIFDVGGSSAFTDDKSLIPGLLGMLNSDIVDYLLGVINPTINSQVGDLKLLPIVSLDSKSIYSKVINCIHVSYFLESKCEKSFKFYSPLLVDLGRRRYQSLRAKIVENESTLDKLFFDLYDVSETDKLSISLLDDGNSTQSEDGENIDSIEQEELYVRWTSYAIGIILGRFHPGNPGSLGSAVYRRDVFAVGSLPAPSDKEFNELVGPPDRFAYVDEEGGRHIFSQETEQALQDLDVEDGITVFDEGHPRDLPTLVEEALILMLGAEDAREVINEGTGGDLRAFLNKKYFTDYHVKWYSVSRRKAPIYWPLQSAELSYGFLIFHEKFQKDTLYVLQRDYLDYKINGLEQRINDLAIREEGLEGSVRREVSRQLGELRRELEEITDFSQKIERIVEDGYQPDPDWIDDGVILRLAPLWELIPIWQDRPRKRWEELQKGEYDWSHIAMNYCPERIKEKCKKNKSYSIAHGHKEWYEGN